MARKKEKVHTDIQTCAREVVAWWKRQLARLTLLRHAWVGLYVYKLTLTSGNNATNQLVGDIIVWGWTVTGE